MDSNYSIDIIKNIVKFSSDLDISSSRKLGLKGFTIGIKR
jgi:hypothetical protein